MAVTSVGVRMYVENPTSKGKGISGGFAVGKYGAAKGTGDLLVVNSGSTNVYTDDVAAKGISGGFAVGKYGAAKEKGLGDLFVVTPDSTRVYIVDAATGISGGFAVGKYGAAKGADSLFFHTDKDSTRVYTDTDGKGVSGGFAVGKYGAAKGPAEHYMHMTKDNYFIGHESGMITEPANGGLYNLFFGYQAGKDNTEGANNCFIGYQSGNSNIGVGGSDSGHYNTFMGYRSGMNNTSGFFNTFVGYKAGEKNTKGKLNCFVGYMAGNSNIGVYDEFFGHHNAFFGNEAGRYNTSGYFNTFIGQVSGFTNTSGYANTYVGNGSGWGNHTGIRNTIMGSGAGIYNSGSYNTYMGSWTARFSGSGSDNCLIGFGSGQYQNNGSRNTYIGSHSGERVDDGVCNVLIGYRAAYTAASTTFSNRLYIANGASVDSTLIYGEFDNHRVGINTRSPLANLHIVGSSTLGSVIISPDETISGDDASLILAEDNDNTYSMYLMYDGSENDMYIYGKANATTYGPHVTIIRDNGNMGLGTPTTVTPAGKLHLYDDVGDVLAIIEADADNNNENDNPRLEFKQDGGAVVGAIGFEGNTAGTLYTGSLQNSLYLINDFSTSLQLGTNNTARITIEGGGDVGIGTTNPAYKIDVLESETNYIARFWNDGGDANRYGIRIQAGNDAGSTSGSDILYIDCRDGDGTFVGSLYSNNGNLQINAKSASPNKSYGIKDTDKGLNIINNLQVVDYDFNSKTNTYKTGFVGEDAIKVFPAMVRYEKEADEYGVANSALVPVLTKSIQEQQIQIENQNSEIELLKKQIQELKELIQK